MDENILEIIKRQGKKEEAVSNMESLLKSIDESNKVFREFKTDILEQIDKIITKDDQPLGGQDGLIDNKIEEEG